jgi:endo-1,4-beta-xylanase
MRRHIVIWCHPRWFPDCVNTMELQSAAEVEAMPGAYVSCVASRAMGGAQTVINYDLSMAGLDVSDTRRGPDIELRDCLIVCITKGDLDIMLTCPQTKELLISGLGDEYSWLQDFMPRNDRMEKRLTLFDPPYSPKPAREALAAALRAAPVCS